MLWAEGRAATERHIVVGAGIFFESKENTKEYNTHLQACVSAVHKMRTMTLSHQNPKIPLLYRRTHGIGLPAVLSSSFAVWFGNGEWFGGTRVVNT